MAIRNGKTLFVCSGCNLLRRWFVLERRKAHGFPIKAYHGAKDTAVFPEKSQKMVTAINANRGHAELTVFPELGHNCWDRVYSDRNTYKWLLEKKQGIIEASGIKFT